MKIQRFFGTALLFLALQLTTLYASAPAIMPVVAYANIKSQKQGDFTGSTITPGFAGQVALVNVEYDEAAAGKSKFIIEKYPDASSSQFRNALINNEVLTRDIIQMVKFDKGVPKVYQVYKLVNANVTSIDFVNNIEKITFKFQKIDVNFIN